MRGLAAAALAAAVAYALHAPGLAGPFISDDYLYLEHNRALSLPWLRALHQVTLEPYFVVGNWSPVHQWFLLAEWRAFGTDPFPYRFVNVLLHAAVSIAVAGAGLRAGLGRTAAGFAGLLFLVHPVAAESVGWINQSKTLLSTGFALVALERWLAHLREPSRARLALATLAGVLALGAKPSATPLPLILAAAAWTHGDRPLRRTLPDLLPIAAATAIVFWLGLVAQAQQGGVAPWFGGSPAATARILPWIAWRYVRLVAFPFDLVHGVHPAPTSGWLDPRVWLPLLGLAAVLGLAVWAVGLRRRRALGLVWFAAMLLPVLQVVPMINLFADRYLYVALPGALWLLADLIDDAAHDRPSRRALAAAALTVALVFSATTRRRAAAWSDPVALYREAAIAYPLGRTGWTGLGAELHKQGDLEGAAAAYLRSLSVHRDDGHVRHLLARVRLAQRREGEALYDLREALKLAPGHPDERWTRETAFALRERGIAARPDEPTTPPLPVPGVDGE
jgi:hypothetical protein